MEAGDLKQFLNKKVDKYNQPFFILDDPISIPHLFSKKQDIEIAGFFAAIFSWGNRTTIPKIQRTDAAHGYVAARVLPKLQYKLCKKT
jgi:Protein of unknown function (DUF2400).